MKLLSPPSPATVFDIERQYFLAAVGQMLAHPGGMTDAEIRDEIDSTICVLRRMAALAGVSIDAAR